MTRPERTWARTMALVLVLPTVVGVWRPRTGAGAPAGAKAVGDVEFVVRFRPGTFGPERRRALAFEHLVVIDSMPGTDFVLAVGPRHPVRSPSRRASSAILSALPPVTERRADESTPFPRQVLVPIPGPAQTTVANAPNDPLWYAQWNLRAVGIPAAWRISTGVGATVAVLDTGVAYERFGPYRQAPDLTGTRFVPGWDFVDGTAHPDDRPVPGRASHGTHIAGTIAEGTNNGLGAAGVAPGAAIMPIRVLSPDGTGTSWAISKGLRFAVDHGANVANLSLGSPAGSPELADAVAYAVANSVTVVASAGDDGGAALAFPAAYPDVLSVGAVRFDNTRSAYSNSGAGLSLVAPGGDLAVDQDGDGLDDGIVQQTLYGAPGTFCYCFLEGTSSAAAHVSAAAAMLFASGRATTPAAIRSRLLATAEPLGGPGARAEYGAGLLRIDRALDLPAVPAPGASRGGPAETPAPTGTTRALALGAPGGFTDPTPAIARAAHGFRVPAAAPAGVGGHGGSTTPEVVIVGLAGLGAILGRACFRHARHAGPNP